MLSMYLKSGIKSLRGVVGARYKLCAAGWFFEVVGRLAGLSIFRRIFKSYGREAAGIWLENPMSGWYFK